MTDSELSEAVAAYLGHGPKDEGLVRLITGMTFSSPPEEQWRMIREATRQARDDHDLGAIAAGPIEGLLGLHGPKAIDWVEEEARANPRFARALTGVRKHMMRDDIWARVRALQAHVPDP